jgi:hypothetical protein
MIDTFLAEVVGTTVATYDAAGHIKEYPTIELNVYDTRTDKTTKANTVNNLLVTSKTETAYTYTAGSYVLVNAYTYGTDTTNTYWFNTVAGDHGTIIETGEQKNTKDQPSHLEIVSAATSIVGAQSVIHFNDGKHTIGGKDYNDASTFYLDKAGLDNATNYTWFFDQYGNLIGDTDIINNNYAVLKNIQWVTVVGSNGYAQATLVDFTGKETTVKVNSIDGDKGTSTAPSTTFAGWDADGFDVTYTDNNTNGAQYANAVGLSDKTTFISNELLKNAGFEGYAMYRVDTRLDGSVDLQGYAAGTPNTYYSNYAIKTTISTASSAILASSTANDTTVNGTKKGASAVVTFVDNSTQFIVKGANNTYTVYTGVASVPTFVANSCEVFYSDINADGIAEYVYVKSATSASIANNHVLYVTSNAYSHQVSNTNKFVMEGVIIDGVATSVTVDASKSTVAALLTNLTANKGKTFVITYDGSNVVDSATLSTVAGTAVDVPTGSSVIYLGDNVTVGNGILVSEYAATSYYVANATVLGTYTSVSQLSTTSLSGRGVWVVYTSGVYNTVSHVYVGTALSETASASIYLNDNTHTNSLLSGYTETGTPVSKRALTIYGTGTDTAVLNAVANDNGTISGTAGKASDTYTNASNYNVRVYSEAGNTNVLYAITRAVGQAANTNITVTMDGASMTVDTTDTSAYSKATWVTLNSNNNGFTFVVTAADSSATVKCGYGDTLANAAAALQAGNTVVISEATDNHGGKIVVEVTNGSDVAYYVYQY